MFTPSDLAVSGEIQLSLVVAGLDHSKGDGPLFRVPGQAGVLVDPASFFARNG